MSTVRSQAQLGERIDEDIELFRAFAEKKFRERKNPPPHVVRYWAFLMREDDVDDGLSVGLTPRASVKFLSRNHGYASIRVSSITALPDNLLVRRDASDPDHAFICNIPLLTVSDASRDAAMRIAKALARAATAVTCDPI